MSGLVYLRARHYHPVLGRFLQRDSFGGFGQRPQSLNRYSYVENSPVTLVDPSGHCPAPPRSMGPTICMALFIEPPTINAGPLTLHGDGREFNSNSDPGASRGYIWIPLADPQNYVAHSIAFQRDCWGDFVYLVFVRDGFPWAEAYYHDGKGNVSTIFQDP